MNAKAQVISREADPSADGQAQTGIYDACGVLRAGGEYRLVVVRPVLGGERLFRMEGERTPRPSRYSVQVGVNLHLDIGPGYAMDEMLDRYLWRFMNHGCDPNVRIAGEDVVALRAIEPWEAVTFNYNTTEWDMAEPFQCLCGSPQCLGRIRGFRHLAAAKREELLPYAAPHLIQQAATESRRRTGPFRVR